MSSANGNSSWLLTFAGNAGIRHNEQTKMKFDFIKPTLIFAIVGLFITDLTAIGLFILQIFIHSLGIECATAWTIIWTTTIIAGLILPYLFYRHIAMLTVDKLQSLQIRLIFFNLFEYIFIQSSLTPLFTSGQKLCYYITPQNAHKLVSTTAWMALPILVIFSFIFNQTIKTANTKIQQ